MVKKVLVVDDAVDIVYILQTALELAGYEVYTATDGNQAWDMISQTKPDLLVLDIMLSGMDGITFNAKLKSNPEMKDLPVIVITGWGQHRDILTAYEKTKVTDFLEKPFPVKLLIDKINGILNLSSEFS
jgi:CheY-like chemotaxis protein